MIGGVLIALKKETYGCVVIFGGFFALAFFNPFILENWFFFSYPVVGLLFIYCWWKENKQSSLPGYKSYY
jgi:hypothetical protein